MFELLRTRQFERRVQRFIRLHPGLSSRLADVLRTLSEDPFAPRLGLHALGGELESLFAIRVTYSYRLLILMDTEAHEITLIHIGSHDELYR
jgi:mRNA-degrading endonuclease YafQ of YafQ-DinJ toxin-antitoxin module